MVILAAAPGPAERGGAVVIVGPAAVLRGIVECAGEGGRADTLKYFHIIKTHSVTMLFTNKMYLWIDEEQEV